MAKGTILIVDDDAVTVELIRAVLEDEYSVHVAALVAQGRAMVGRVKPDLLVLDRDLPDGDGLELCGELRRSAPTRSLPILMLTGRRTVADKVAGLKLGADDYLAKPFHTDELLARVEALLRRSEADPGQPLTD